MSKWVRWLSAAALAGVVAAGCTSDDTELTRRPDDDTPSTAPDTAADDTVPSPPDTDSPPTSDAPPTTEEPRTTTTAAPAPTTTAASATTVPATIPPTPGRGLDGDIDALPAAVPGQVTVVSAALELEPLFVVFIRNGTDQPVADNYLSGRLLGPDGSVLLELDESDYEFSTPYVLDPGGVGMFTFSTYDFGGQPLPAGSTAEFTVNPQPEDTASLLEPMEISGLSISGSEASGVVTNEGAQTLGMPAPYGVCLDDAGTPLDVSIGDADLVDLAPGDSAPFTLEFDTTACTKVVATA